MHKATLGVGWDSWSLSITQHLTTFSVTMVAARASKKAQRPPFARRHAFVSNITVDAA